MRLISLSRCYLTLGVCLVPIYFFASGNHRPGLDCAGWFLSVLVAYVKRPFYLTGLDVIFHFHTSLQVYYSCNVIFHFHTSLQVYYSCNELRRIYLFPEGQICETDNILSGVARGKILKNMSGIASKVMRGYSLRKEFFSVRAALLAKKQKIFVNVSLL